MTLDGLLAVLALTAAIYALIPPVPRLRVRLALWVQLPLAVAALLIVLYLELFDTVGQPCPSRIGRVCEQLTIAPEGTFRPNQLAFLVVLAWMLLAWAIHKVARPGAGALVAIRRLADRLIYEQRFAELIDFIEPYLPFIGRTADRKLPLQRLSAQLEEWRGEGLVATWRAILNQPDPKPTAGLSAWRKLLPVIGKLGRWTPSQRQAEEAAHDLLRLLFTTPALRRFIVESRPYFALPLLMVRTYERADFFDAYMKDLAASPSSALFQELEQNQNFANGHRYALPERNRLLWFLLADAERAEELSAWKPVGDYMLKLLRTGDGPGYLEHLNRSPEGFEAERWHDPVFAGVFYFDVMVTSAAYQGVRYHMWLMYLFDVVERLVESYDDSDPSVDVTDEFPTRGARLLYEAVNTLGNWVRLVDELPTGSFHQSVPADPFHGEGRIPVTSAQTLGRSMRTVLMAQNVSSGLRQYMLEVAVRDLKYLGRTPEGRAMRGYLARALVYAGAEREMRRDYVLRLAATFQTLDHVMRSDVPELSALLSEALGVEVR
jgi:hypothetical protein